MMQPLACAAGWQNLALPARSASKGILFVPVISDFGFRISNFHTAGRISTFATVAGFVLVC
jgi:hypothetical protein